MLRPNVNVNISANPNFAQNRMLQQYQMHQQQVINNRAFQQNNMINNQQFRQAMPNYSQEDKMRIQMERDRKMRMTQQLQRMNELRQMKEQKKYNEIEKFIDRDPNKFKDAIIEPIKTAKPCNPQELIGKSNEKERNEYNKNYVDKMQNARTNQPYKSALKDVMKDTEYYKKIRDKQKDDLIVHTTTDADKDEVQFKHEYKKFKKVIKEEDTQLNIIYSASNKSDNLKKFKYNNKYKFRIKYDPADFKKLKKGKMEYYENEQKQFDKDAKNLENLIETALNSGILNDDEIKMIIENNNKNVTEDELVKDLGEESREIVRATLKITQNKNQIPIEALQYYEGDEDEEDKEDKEDKEDENKQDLATMLRNRQRKTKL